MPPSNDGGARITGYHVQVKEDTPGATWRDTGKVGGFDSKFTVKDLAAGKNYKFAVLAENENGLSEPCVADKSAAPKKSVSKCGLLGLFLHVLAVLVLSAIFSVPCFIDGVSIFFKL